MCATVPLIYVVARKKKKIVLDSRQHWAKGGPKYQLTVPGRYSHDTNTIFMFGSKMTVKPVVLHVKSS